MDAIETLRQQIAGTTPAIEVGTTVRYIKQFAPKGTFYTYSAIFTGDAWYTTSKHDKAPGIYSHEDFILMLQGEEIVKVQLATAFEDIIDNTDKPAAPAKRPTQRPAGRRAKRPVAKPAHRQGNFGAAFATEQMPPLKTTAEV